jgi:hypothetical protein
MAYLKKLPDSLTQWCYAKESVKTARGVLSYGDWCAQESARMNANGADTFVGTHEGRIAVQRRTN